MTRILDASLAQAFPAAPWLFQPAGPDAVAVLTSALGTEWAVERTTDCEGDISIIVFSTQESDDELSFILYENGGHVRLATMRADEWQFEQPFASFRHAVRALIATANSRNELLLKSGGVSRPRPGSDEKPTLTRHRDDTIRGA